MSSGLDMKLKSGHTIIVICKRIESLDDVNRAIKNASRFVDALACNGVRFTEGEAVKLGTAIGKVIQHEISVSEFKL